jgi:trimeric autotransporter adhesin
MAKLPSLRFPSRLALAGAVSTIAISSALAGNISSSLPETGSLASGGSDFQITNPGVGSSTVRPTAITGIATGSDGRAVVGGASGSDGVGVYGYAGTGFGGYFLLNGPHSTEFSAALYAASTGGNPHAVGNYGYAADFTTTNANNLSDVVHINGNSEGNALTSIIGGTGGGNNAIIGEDYTDDGGFAVSGNSFSGSSAYFSGGSGGNGICSFNGSGGWSCTSDRNLKEHFSAVDLDQVLDRLDALPVFTYQMKRSKLPTRYLGPTAQDFKAAFGLGESDTTINTANAQGVALAAAKGLYRKLREDEATIAELKTDNDTMKQVLADQKKEMASLRASVERVAQSAPALVEARLTP